MNPKLAVSLRWLAAFGMLLPLTALLALEEILLSDNGRLWVWKSLAVLLCGLCAFGLGEATASCLQGGKKALAAVAKGLGALCALGLPTAALRGPAGLGQALFTGVLCICAWALGLAASRRSYGEVLRPFVFYVGLICFAAPSLARWVREVFSQGEYPLNPLVLALFLFGASFVFCRNQFNIDMLMRRRRHRMEHLPGRIRRYNLLLAGGMLALVSVGFCFRVPIAAGLRAVGQMLVGLLYLAVQAMIFFSSLFAGESVSGPAPGSGETPFGELLGGDAPSRDDTWLFTVLVLLLVWLAFLKRRELFAWIRRGWAVLRALWQKFFGRQRSDLGRLEESEYYEDRVEDLQPRGRQRALEERLNSRRWKKRCRALCRCGGDRENIREGYGLMLRWLALRGETVPACGTPEEICRMAAQTAGEDWSGPTRAYSRVRYGELAPTDGEWKEMCRTLTGLAEKL